MSGLPTPSFGTRLADYILLFVMRLGTRLADYIVIFNEVRDEVSRLYCYFNEVRDEVSRLNCYL